MATITLKQSERQELRSWVRGQSRDAAQARRARLILLIADGERYGAIGEKLGCDTNFIARWKKRFLIERLAGLYSRHTGRVTPPQSERKQARILKWTLQKKPSDGSTHWSGRKLALELGDVSHMTIARVWSKHGIRPHRVDGYMSSSDIDFEAKAADVIGLYLHPPQHAAVFSVDEKTAIQALDRKDPVLPLTAGRAERHGFEYYRHGTLSLYAAFNTQSGEVLGKTAERHTSAEFVAFLTDIVASQPNKKEIHVILDNLSAHRLIELRVSLRIILGYTCISLRPIPHG
jgi:transposase